MAKLHNPGTYPARIIDYGIWKGKKGPMAALVFEYKIPTGGSERITWFGSFNGGARDFTIDTLIRCGFQGKNGAELNKGKGSGVLDETKDFEIVIGNEPKFGTTTGELQSRVKFVNLPGGANFREKMADSGEAAVLMGGLNLEGDFMAARQKVSHGKPQMQQPGQQAPAPSQGQMTDDEDIPF